MTDLYEYAITYLDDFGRKTTRRGIVTGTGTTVALANLNDFVVATQAICEGAIIEQSVKTRVGISATPTADANVDTGVTWSLGIGGVPAKRGILRMPMPVPGILLPDGSVNMAHADVITYVATVVGGLILVSDGEDVDEFYSGKLDR